MRLIGEVMKYRVTWEETVYYSAIVDAETTEDAVDALHAGDYDSKEVTDYEFDGESSKAELIEA